MSTLPSFAELRGGDAVLRVKAVPGARRDEIVGLLGDRIKVRVAAPPEDGKANAAIVSLLAKALGLVERDLELVQGTSNPMKTFLLRDGATRIEAIVGLLRGA